MINLFPSLTYQPLATWVDLSVEASFDFFLSGLSRNDLSRVRFYLNSEQQSGPFPVQAGDILGLSILTSDQYSTPVFAQFFVDQQLSVVGLSTLDDSSLRFNPYYSSKTYFDRLTTTSGEEVLLESDENSYAVLDLAGNLTAEFNLNTEISGVESTAYSYILEPKSTQLNKVDLETYLPIKKIDMAAPCLGIVQTVHPATGSRCTWLTMANGSIVCLDDQDQVVYSYTINGVGYGIDASADGRLIVVADSQANQLALFEWMGAEWQKSFLQCGTLPYDVYIDYGKNVWVTSRFGSKVYVYDYGRPIPSAIEVGKGQKTIKQISYSSLGLVCTETEEFIELDIYYRTVINRVRVSPSPIDFCSIASQVYIAKADNTVFRLEADNSLAWMYDARPAIYALESDAERKQIYVVSLYRNTPSLLAVPDRVSDDFVVESPEKVYAGYLYNADSVPVQDITGEMVLGFPDIFGLELVVDGWKQDLVTPFNPGSSFSFRFKAPELLGESLYFPAFLGNNLRYYSTTVYADTERVFSFSFDDVLFAEPGTLYRSNTITLSGLEAPKYLTSSQGRLYVNGVQELSPCLVENGDLITLELESNPEFGLNTSTTITLSNYTEVWTINTKTDLVDYVLVPGLKDRPLFQSGLAFNYRELISFYHVTTKVFKTLDLSVLAPTNLIPITAHYTATPTLRLYGLDLSNETICCAVDLTASPFATILTSVPKVCVSFPSANRVTCYDQKLKNPVDIYVDSPYGLAGYDVSLWVAGGPMGVVQQYRYDYVQAKYVFQKSYNLNGFIYSLYYDAATRTLFCTDLLNKKAKLIRDGVIVESYATGTNPYSVSKSNNTLFVTNAFDNSLTVVDLESQTTTTQPLEWSAHSLVQNYTINLENNFVFTTDGNAVTPVINTGLQNSSITQVASQLVIEHYCNNQDIALTLSLAGASEDFIEQVDVDPATFVESNEIVFSDLIRPMLVEAETFPDLVLIKNGEEYGNKVVVENGDRLAVRFRASPQYETVSSVRLNSKDWTKVFNVTTRGNKVPRYIKFTSAYSKLTSFPVYTEDREIEGLGEGVISLVDVSDPTVTVYVNSVQQTVFPFPVTNGDMISLSWMVEMLYSSITTHQLSVEGEVFASYSIYSENLLGPTSYSPFCNFTEVSSPYIVQADQYRAEQDVGSLGSPFAIPPSSHFNVQQTPVLGLTSHWNQEFLSRLQRSTQYSISLSYRALANAHYLSPLQGPSLLATASFPQDRDYFIGRSELWSGDNTSPSLDYNTSYQQPRDYDYVQEKRVLLERYGDDSAIYGLSNSYYQDRSYTYQNDRSYYQNRDYAYYSLNIYQAPTSFALDKQSRYDAPSSLTLYRDHIFAVPGLTQSYMDQATFNQSVSVKYEGLTNILQAPSMGPHFPLSRVNLLSALPSVKVEALEYNSLFNDVYASYADTRAFYDTKSLDGMESGINGVQSVLSDPVEPQNGVILSDLVPSLFVENSRQTTLLDGIVPAHFNIVLNAQYKENEQFFVPPLPCSYALNLVISRRSFGTFVLPRTQEYPLPANYYAVPMLRDPLRQGPFIPTPASEHHSYPLAYPYLYAQPQVSPEYQVFPVFYPLVQPGYFTPLTFYLDVTTSGQIGRKFFDPVDQSYHMTRKFFDPVDQSYHMTRKFFDPVDQSYWTIRRFYDPVDQAYTVYEDRYRLIQMVYSQLSSPYSTISFSPVCSPDSAYTTTMDPQQARGLFEFISVSPFGFNSRDHLVSIREALTRRNLPSSFNKLAILLADPLWKEDQSSLLPQDRGSLSLAEAMRYAEDDPALIVVKLSDGTYLYRYEPLNVYGECMATQCIITHGFIKGG